MKLPVDYTSEVLLGLTQKKYSRKNRVYNVTTHYLIAVIKEESNSKWICKCPYCNRWYMQLPYHCELEHPDKTNKDLIKDFWGYKEYPVCSICGGDIPPRSLNQMHPRKYGLFCHSTCTATVKASLGINPLQKDNRPKDKKGNDLYTLKGVKTRIEKYGTNSNLCHKSNSLFGFDSTWEDKFYIKQCGWKHHCKRMTEVILYKSSLGKLRQYQPDFIFHTYKIEGKPLVVEVKSQYTYNSDIDIENKIHAAFRKGYSLIMIDPRIADGLYWPNSLSDCERIYKLEQENLNKYKVIIPEYVN